MEPFRTLSSHVVVLPRANIDTDQIIPASYLKITDKEGLGEGLFSNWRYREDGTPDPDFVLHHPRSEGARILVAGENFGCGSSREHAPWALLDYGFRAVVSSRFADIFRGNALKNGLLTVTLEPEMHRRLLEDLEGRPETALRIDLEAQTLAWDGGELRTSVEFRVDPFARRCLLRGVDQLGYLLDRLPAIEAYEARHPPRLDTRAEA